MNEHQDNLADEAKNPSDAQPISPRPAQADGSSRSDHIDELRRQIEVLNQQRSVLITELNELVDEEVRERCAFKIGDVVEAVWGHRGDHRRYQVSRIFARWTGARIYGKQIKKDGTLGLEKDITHNKPRLIQPASAGRGDNDVAEEE